MVRAQQITDPDVGSLAEFALALEPQYRVDNSDWEGSPFAWILSRKSGQVGAIGKRLISSFLQERGFEVERCPGRGADRMVNGRRVAVKFSMIWEEGVYKFQQIREQRYDFLICLGLSPFEAHSWVFTKAFLLENRGNLEGFTFQHRGQEGIDTAWIHIRPAAPHEWLAPHGGTLPEALGRLSHLLGE